MTYLILSIFFNALIFIYFKWLSKARANTFLVVIWNYFTAGLVSLFMHPQLPNADVFLESWLIPTACLGAAFVFVFYLMAITTREAGAAKATVANKISLIIPVIAALYLYGDQFGIYKLAGLLFTVLGLLLMVSGRAETSGRKAAFLVVILFAISGFMDAGLKFIQHFYLPIGRRFLFTSVLFLSASLTGGISLLVLGLKGKLNGFRKEMTIAFIPGLVLGLINIGSIYFLVAALQQPEWESSVIFPLNNIGVIIISTLVAAIVFKEKLYRKNYFGLLISIMALLFLFLSSYLDQ